MPAVGRIDVQIDRGGVIDLVRMAIMGRGRGGIGIGHGIHRRHPVKGAARIHNALSGGIQPKALVILPVPVETDVLGGEIADDLDQVLRSGIVKVHPIKGKPSGSQRQDLLSHSVPLEEPSAQALRDALIEAGRFRHIVYRTARARVHVQHAAYAQVRHQLYVQVAQAGHIQPLAQRNLRAEDGPVEEEHQRARPQDLGHEVLPSGDTGRVGAVHQGFHGDGREAVLLGEDIRQGAAAVGRPVARPNRNGIPFGHPGFFQRAVQASGPFGREKEQLLVGRIAG